MDIGNSFLLGFEILPKSTAIINGVEVEVIFNTSAHRDNKVLGGYDHDAQVTIFAKTSDLTNPKSLKGKIMTLEGTTWKIAAVNYGTAITSLYAVSADSK